MQRLCWRQFAYLFLLALGVRTGAAQVDARQHQAGGVDLTLRARADYVYTTTPDGQRRVTAMVIWRGPERWYRAHRRSAITLPMRSTSDTLPLVIEATHGDIRTSFTYVPSSRTLRVLDQEFVMNADSNVVLVDLGASSDSPPRVVGRAQLWPIPDGGDADRRKAVLQQAQSQVFKEFLELP
jgi:hypothetical protein